MKYLACVLVIYATATAHAQGIVLESYSGERPDDLTRLLSPFHEELATRGFTAGDTLARRYEAAVSRPALTKEGLPSDFEDRIERGHKAWIGGRFDEAISTLGPLIDAAHLNSGAFAQNQPLRTRLLKGVIAFALSQQRKGDLAAAKAMLAEVLRSFPDTELSRAQYGPEAFELFAQVRRAHGQSGRGRLVVKVPTGSTVVFVNERFENVGNVSKADVVPGEYRVYAQDAQRLSRVHQVTVKADETAELAIDVTLDSTLRTSGSWTGFAFANARERAQREARYSVDFARTLRAQSLIVVGLEVTNGRPAIAGALLDLHTGREIRRASLAFEPEPTAERLRALARFLAGEDPVEGIDVQLREVVKTAAPAPEPRTDRAPRSRRTWMLYAGIAGIGLGLASIPLAVNYVGDARDAGNELKRVCAVSCTPDQARSLGDQQDRANRNAVISGVAGGLVAATGVVFIVLWRRSPSPPAVAVLPSTHGAVATYALTF